MKKTVILTFIFAGLLASCAVTDKRQPPVISPYSWSRNIGQSAIVYGLPQTRLFFKAELAHTVVKKGPYAEYANRMLGLQNVPLTDSDTWQLLSIDISSRQEVDSRQLYTVSFMDYPQNLDILSRFSSDGLLLDLNIGNVLANSRMREEHGNDIRFVNPVVSSNTAVKVDTLYTTVRRDTVFVDVPVLQSRAISKTTEELARDAAQQIFNIRQWRMDVLRGDADYPADGMAFRMVLETFDRQEAQLMSLFIGKRMESTQTSTYHSLPEKPADQTELFYFSEKSGITDSGVAGARAVWYETGSVAAPASININQQAENVVYYRIPQMVEVKAGIGGNTLVSGQVSVCQFGNIVSIPLISAGR